MVLDIPTWTELQTLTLTPKLDKRADSELLCRVMRTVAQSLNEILSTHDQILNFGNNDLRTRSGATLGLVPTRLRVCNTQRDVLIPTFILPSKEQYQRFTSTSGISQRAAAHVAHVDVPIFQNPTLAALTFDPAFKFRYKVVSRESAQADIDHEDMHALDANLFIRDLLEPRNPHYLAELVAELHHFSHDESKVFSKADFMKVANYRFDTYVKDHSDPYLLNLLGVNTLTGLDDMTRNQLINNQTAMLISNFLCHPELTNREVIRIFMDCRTLEELCDWKTKILGNNEGFGRFSINIAPPKGVSPNAKIGRYKGSSNTFYLAENADPNEARKPALDKHSGELKAFYSGGIRYTIVPN